MHSAAFSPDGKRIVTASYDKTARLWDAETGKQIGAPLVGHESVCLARRSAPTASASSPRLVTRPRGCGTPRPANKSACRSGHEDAVISAAFSPDGKRIVTASSDKTARLWDAATGEQIGAPLVGHEDVVNSAAFSPDGKRIVTASEDKTARLWDAATGKQIGAPLAGYEDAVNSAAFSPDGKRIVTASDDKTARLWDAETGKQIGVLVGHKDRVFSAAFSPDGERIVTASADETARLWDVATTQQLVSAAKAAIPRCLTAEQRTTFFLLPEPPAWCVVMEKWPYQTAAWNSGLSTPAPAKIRRCRLVSRRSAKRCYARHYA